MSSELDTALATVKIRWPHTVKLTPSVGLTFNMDASLQNVHRALNGKTSLAV